MKIAKNLESNFINHVYIEDFFMENHELLRNFYTAYTLSPRLKELSYLASFEKLNDTIFKKYEVLKTFVCKFYKENPIMPDKYKEVILSLCRQESIFIQEHIDTMEELEEYCEDLEILNFVDDICDDRSNDRFYKRNISKTYLYRSVLHVLKSNNKAVGVIQFSDVHFNELVELESNKYDFTLSIGSLFSLVSCTSSLVLYFPGSDIECPLYL